MESPIVRSQPYCICIRTAIGSFLNYTRESLLHCGVSDSNGFVFHFDENGRHRSKWTESVCYHLDTNGMFAAETEKRGSKEEKLQRWDDKLVQFSNLHEKDGAPYHPLENNCYDFVTSFLNEAYLNLPQRYPFTKDTVAVQMLEPRMLELEKYMSYFRQLTNN